jgi:hypothetical protein
MIVDQILACPLPITPLMPQLVKAFVTAMLQLSSMTATPDLQEQQQRFRFTTLAEPTIRSVLGLPRAPLRRFAGIVPLPVSCAHGNSPATVVRPKGDAIAEAAQYGEAARFLVALFVLEFNEQGLAARSELKAQAPQQPHHRAAFFASFGFPPDLLWEIPIERLVADASADPRCAAIAEPLSILAMS